MISYFAPARHAWVAGIEEWLEKCCWAIPQPSLRSCLFSKAWMVSTHDTSYHTWHPFVFSLAFDWNSVEDARAVSVFLCYCVTFQVFVVTKSVLGAFLGPVHGKFSAATYSLLNHTAFAEFTLVNGVSSGKMSRLCPSLGKAVVWRHVHIDCVIGKWSFNCCLANGHYNMRSFHKSCSSFST